MSHSTQPVLRAGADSRTARLALIVVHGRGGSAREMLVLAGEFQLDDVAVLAPQAAGNTWYPYSFLSPMDRNEPGLSSCLGVLAGLVGELGEAGMEPHRVAILGFSQGACLVLEYAGWGGQQPGFVGALSGGVMGPLDLERSITGDRTGIRVFIGCGDRDGHIPLAHAERSARLLEGAGATVDYRAYLGFSHAINDNEIEALRAAVTRLVDTDT